MGKKKFIDKDRSQRFHLLHRSYTDQAHAQENTPSEYVLIPAEPSLNDRRRATAGVSNDDFLEDILSLSSSSHFIEGEGDHHNKSLRSLSRKDHINELGFVNDGYDYSQHFKDPTGGQYFGNDARGVTFVPQSINIDLPDEVLPSAAGNFDRDFGAITISHEFMDPDIHAALFEDADENGTFEELDDDFVAQVMVAPEKPDFDFDAHLARLIARSEQSLGITKPRGWGESEDNIGLKQWRDRFGTKNEDILEGDEDEDDDEYYDSDELKAELEEDTDDIENMMKQRLKLSAMSSAQRDALEVQFERTLQEYDDDQIGDLEELTDDDLQGSIDFEAEDGEENEHFEAALDEFLEQQRDLKYVAGIVIEKGIRSDVKLSSDIVKEGDKDEDSTDNVDIVKLAAEQALKQEEWKEEIKRLDEGESEKGFIDDIMRNQPYLLQEKVIEEWDCETIISTYSTMENLPSVIRGDNKSFRPYKSRFVKNMEQQARRDNSDFGSLAGDSLQSHQSKPASLSAQSVTNSKAGVQPKIILSGKLNLPEGFAPGANRKVRQPKSHLAAVRESHEAERGSDDDSDSSSDNNDSNEDGKATDGDQQWKPDKIKKKETAEEKKARKNAVKEERRIKRMAKKQLKDAFRSESGRLARNVGREQTTDHISVFKYSA